MKNIRIEAVEWRDKVNGNSYFSSRGYVDGELVAIAPFQYGYGDHYVYVTWKRIAEKLELDVEYYPYGSMQPMWQYCHDRSITYSSHKSTGLKREVVAYGKES